MAETTSFEVLEIRASGAYATVCRARRSGDGLGREVAVKALRATLVNNARALARTRDEARLLARLSHPNIVRVEELLSLDRRPVLVLEWVEGVSLRELLECHRSGVPIEAVLEIISQASRALDAAWNAPGDGDQPLRIVHRDIKPGNLLVSQHGRLKVVDFGLSRGEYFERETTTVSTVLGSMGYMAPERFMTGIGDDPAIDIYALGLCLIELAAGRLPLLARDPTTHDRAIRGIAGELKPQNLDPVHQQIFQQLVVDMCRFDPTCRPQHAALRDRIDALLSSAGLVADLPTFAAQFVVPMVDGRPKIEPRQHSKWEEVAFLEDPPKPKEPRAQQCLKDEIKADRRVHRFLNQPDWAHRKRELKWLLALHPQWTAAPFLDVLYRTTKPWWLFWVQAASIDEVVVALEILRHRPAAEVGPYAQQLRSHNDKRVSDAATVLVELVSARRLGS
jgi:serine/threonine protein kinase